MTIQIINLVDIIGGLVVKNKEFKPELKKDDIFKKIGTYKGKNLSNYEISNYGNIRNITNKKFLKPCTNYANVNPGDDDIICEV